MRRLLVVALIHVCSLTAFTQTTNDWLMERLRAAIECKHVDYEALMDTIQAPNKKIDPLIRSLAVIEYCRAFGEDSLALQMIDFIFSKCDDKRIEGVVWYLLDTKYELLAFNNNFVSIDSLSDYIANRWAADSRFVERATYWKKVAQAGKGIMPVKIARQKQETKLALERNAYGQDYMCINVDIGKYKNRKLIVDTGLGFGTVIFRKKAIDDGIALLPDSTKNISASNPDITYNMQAAVLDSLHIDGITIYNLPVSISDEEYDYGCDGFIGTADLSRLGYMELSVDSIIFRQQIPDQRNNPNMTLYGGKRNGRVICVPYTLDGERTSFVLDTGADSFLLPQLYADRPMILAEIGGQSIWIEAGKYPHAFVPDKNSRSYIGTPILGMFKRVCINFRDCHIDFIGKRQGKEGIWEYTNQKRNNE